MTMTVLDAGVGPWQTGTPDDPARLAAALGRFLDEVPAERERLEEYVDTLTPAQRLRLAGALHLLSHRLDEDLADPEQREALRAA